MHVVKMVDEFLLSPSLKRLLRESSVTLHTCKEEGCVLAVHVKCCDNRFPSQPKNRINVIFETNREISFPLLLVLLLVIDVAGVVYPLELTEHLTPPRGQMQSHMEAVFSLRSWVPPAEPIPLKLSRFLLRNLEFTVQVSVHVLISNLLL